MKANTNTHFTIGLATAMLAGEGNMKRHWIVRGALFGGVGAAVLIIFQLGPLDHSWAHSGGAIGYAVAFAFFFIIEGIPCAVAGAGIAWIWQQSDARANAAFEKREKEIEERNEEWKRGRS